MATFTLAVSTFRAKCQTLKISVKHMSGVTLDQSLIRTKPYHQQQPARAIPMIAFIFIDPAVGIILFAAPVLSERTLQICRRLCLQDDLDLQVCEPHSRGTPQLHLCPNSAWASATCLCRLHMCEVMIARLLSSAGALPLLYRHNFPWCVHHRSWRSYFNGSDEQSCSVGSRFVGLTWGCGEGRNEVMRLMRSIN